jgi:hypothetical protein
MSALERTLVEPVMTFAPWTTARGVLESASVAAWLLEVEVEPLTRVSRGMTLRLKHLEDEKTYAGAALERHPEAAEYLKAAGPHVEQRIKSIVEQATTLEVPQKHDRNGRLIGFNEVMPSVTELADLAFSEGATYRLLSAVAHGRWWARRAVGLRPVEGKKAVEPYLTLEAALFLILNAIDWFTRPTWAYFKLNGWDLQRLASTLELQYNQAALNESTRFWRHYSVM